MNSQAASAEVNDSIRPQAKGGCLQQACSALEVAEMVAQARDLLAVAVEVIEQRKTFPGGMWKEGMRTRGEGEGKYKLREALVELRSKAEWLKQDATAMNGGWPNGQGQPRRAQGRRRAKMERMGQGRAQRSRRRTTRKNKSQIDLTPKP